MQVGVVGSLLGTSLCTLSQARQINESASRPAREKPMVPARLEASIKANFPAYRIPQGQDITAGWVNDKLGASPFFCLGDFNGDGIVDAAIILVGKDTWRVVVFEQDQAGAYRPAFIGRPKTQYELGKYSENEILLMPQQLLLRKVSKGDSWTPEAGDDPHLGHLKVDALELVSKPYPNASFASLLIWEKGKYQQIFSDPLVELPTNVP